MSVRGFLRVKYLQFVIATSILGTIMVVGFVGVTSGEDHAAEATSAFGVYLEPAYAPEDSRLQVSADYLSDIDVQVVQSSDELEAAVASSFPQSIWINRAALESVSRDWLRQQMNDGVVIVGIDTTTSELAEVLGVSAWDGSDWRHPTLPTFAIYYQALDVGYINIQGEPAERSLIGWFNESFDPEHPEQLYNFTKEAVREVDKAYGDPEPQIPSR